MVSSSYRKIISQKTQDNNIVHLGFHRYFNAILPWNTTILGRNTYCDSRNP